MSELAIWLFLSLNSSNWHAYSSALGGSVDELLTEVLPVAVVGGVLDNDLLVVVGELVDNVLVLLVKLQVVESSYAVLGNGGSVSKKQIMRLARLSQNWLSGCCVLPRGGRHNHDRGGGEMRSEARSSRGENESLRARADK